jgi:ribosomal protein S18 acetylase RimI-like enzyme
VAPAARGQGIGTLMCEHSQLEAAAMGFRAMQFDLVVSTNDRAVRLLQKLGFTTVGSLPRAFRHLRFGYVDALAMYKEIATAPD